MIELPENIINSRILSAKQVHLLANVTEMPTVDPSFEDDRLKNIFQYYSLTPDDMEVEVHKYAGSLLDQGKVKDAWQVLLTTNVV